MSFRNELDKVGKEQEEARRAAEIIENKKKQLKLLDEEAALKEYQHFQDDVDAVVMPILDDLLAFLGRGRLEPNKLSNPYRRFEYSAEVVWDYESRSGRSSIKIECNGVNKEVRILSGGGVALPRIDVEKKSFFKTTKPVEPYDPKTQTDNRLFLGNPELKTAIEETIIRLIRENKTYYSFDY